MSAAAGRGVRLVEVPRGVGGADDPVPAPRDHEEHRLLGAHDEARPRSGSGRAARRGGCPWTPARAATPRPPTISWISSVQTPAALTTTRARTSSSGWPSSRSDARTPTTRSPSRRKPVTLTRVATCAPWRGRGAGDRQHQPGVVDLAVVVADRARDRLGSRSRARSGRPAVRDRCRCRGTPISAVPSIAMRVVEQQPGADVRPLPPAVGQRVEERHRAHQVRRQPGEQQAALLQRLADQAEVEHLEVAQAAVDQLAAAAAGAAGQVALLQQPGATARGSPRRGRPRRRPRRRRRPGRRARRRAGRPSRRAPGHGRPG